MLGTFSYVNPTKLYFGEDALDSLHGELARYGDRVLLASSVPVRKLSFYR